VDNDGAKDLAFIGSGGSVNVWKWNVSLQTWISLSANLPSSGNFQKTVLYDMNNDNYTDIVLFGKGSGSVYAGNGGTNWVLEGSFSTPTVGNYQALAVKDVDNNGFADIAVLFEQGSFPSYINHLKFFKETTSYSTLSIKPLFPKGSENLKNNQVRYIEWSSTAPASPQSLVRLELSTQGSSGPWILIEDSVKNNGRYQWTVPSAVSSANCYIKYTIYNSGGTYSVVNSNPFMIGILLGITSHGEIPSSYALHQNYPNPFNPVTNIKFDIPENSFVTLKVFNISGREVAVILSEKLNAGTYETSFDASSITSGIYFYRLSAEGTNNFLSSGKMIYLK